MNIQKQSRILMRTAAVLLLLVLVSTSMVTGRYARYTTTVTASDSARVARFSVKENVTFFSETETVCAEFAPGEMKEITISVENDSEVTIAYTIQAANPYENFPLDFYMKDNSALPFTASMQPGEKADFVLVAHWDAGNGGNDISYSGKVDLIEITLNATQVD